MGVDLTHATLAECEEVIQKSVEAFFDAGRALVRIRDQRLYKGRFDSFERYCQQRWGFTRQRSSQLIAAAEVVTTVAVGNNGNGAHSAPTNERVARELAPLRDKPEEMRAAWQEAEGRAAQYGRAPTSSDVRSAVQGRVMGPVARVPTNPAPGSEEKVAEIVEAWALVARGAKEVVALERDLMLAADLTDNQRWRITEAHKHAMMTMER